jgi:L-lactate dehydrogenase (cytochrome)
MAKHLGDYLSVADFERAARRRLPRCVFEYVRGGTEDERSLRGSLSAFDRAVFRPRGLCDVSERSQSVSLFGRRWSSPLGLAPTGLAGIVRHECDLQLARQAAHAGIPFVLSGASTVPMETLRQEGIDCWYQAYLPGDRARIGAVADRVERAGIEVLVVTIDTCVGANRENNQRNRFTVPFAFSPGLLLDGLRHPRWSVEVFARTLLNGGIPRFCNMNEGAGSRITDNVPNGFRGGRDRLSWDDIGWLRERWKGRLVLKGVLHPGDAEKAERLGADAIVVSSHGGRQLDGAMAPLDALPDIVPAVSSGFPVLMDGGIRRGTDVLKARALGAHMVFMGRPTLYGAAVAGEAGVARVIAILQEEIDRDLALLGCSDITQVDGDCIRLRP